MIQNDPRAIDSFVISGSSVLSSSESAGRSQLTGNRSREASLRKKFHPPRCHRSSGQYCLARAPLSITEIARPTWGVVRRANRFILSGKGKANDSNKYSSRRKNYGTVASKRLSVYPSLLQISIARRCKRTLTSAVGALILRRVHFPSK